MRQTLAAFVLGLAAYAGTAIAHATPSVNTAGVGVTIENVWFDADLSLLSDDGGTVRIGLTGLDVTDGYTRNVVSPLDPPFYTFYRYQDNRASGLLVDIRDGYKITGITLSGTVTGDLKPGVPPAAQPPAHSRPGVATNEAAFGLYDLGSSGPGRPLATQTLSNVQGSHSFSFSTNEVFHDDFKLAIYSAFDLYVDAGLHWYYYPGQENSYSTYVSTASISFSDLVLTVQVSPVPEPSTWAMLAAGLGLLSVAARSRRKT